MSDQHNGSSNEQDELRGEMLSALLDGETSEFETRRIVQSFDQADEKKWRSYSIIQQAMHNPADQLNLSIDVSAAVHKALDDEPIHSLPLSSQHPLNSEHDDQFSSPVKVSYLKPIAGFAAAAAFAFVAVLNLDGFDSEQSSQGFVAEGNVSASQLNIQGGVGLSAVSAQIELNQPGGASQPLHQNIDAIEQQKLENQQRFNFYLQQHAEHSSLSNGRGLMPMVRVVNDEQ